MSVSELSPSTQNYLKAVWGLTEWSTEPVTPTLIADRTGLKLSTVSDAVRKMSAQGLVHHAPYGAVELTEKGRTFALAMVRRHRLIESFLVSVLGYSWDQVHDEADNLEHAVSDFLVDRIDEFLKFPSHDPHGDPIPSADGAVDIPDAKRLTELGADATVVVKRISDSDAALLQFFEARGIVVGAIVEVRDGPAYSDSLDVHVRGSEGALALGRSATDSLYVSLWSGDQAS